MEHDPTSDGKLPTVGFLADLDAEVREHLAAAGRFVVAPVGEYLAVQGEHHHSLVTVLSGKVSVTVHAHGDTINLATLGAGQTIGEMSIIDPGNASAHVRVVDEPAKLWVIEGDDFDRFVEADTAAGFAIMKTLARELCQRLRRGSETMLRQKDELRSKFLDMDY